MSTVHGASVYREIDEQADRRVSLGAVYTTLSRLEERGMVTSSMGDPTPERGGRAKRYFKIEPSGTEALEAASSALGSLLGGTELAWC